MRGILLAAALFALGASCDGGIVGSSTVNGDYSLRTVNGSPLPYTTSGSGANKTEILDDVITLYEGFTYAETAHMRVTVNGQVSTTTRTEAGAYSLFGTSITLTPGTPGPAVRRGLIEGNELRIAESGLISVFRK